MRLEVYMKDLTKLDFLDLREMLDHFKLVGF